MSDRPLQRTVSPPTPVPNQPITPPAHSLHVSAREVKPTDDRWLGGMSWVPETKGLGWATWDALPLDDEGAAATGGPGPKSEPGPGADELRYQPFFIELASECSAVVDATLDIQARAERQLEAITPLALEEEFWDGLLRPSNLSLRRSTPAVSAYNGQGPDHDDEDDGSPLAHNRLRSGILNPSFVNGSTLTAVTPAVALRLLTLGLARSEVPAKGMIHAPAPLVEAWDAAGMLEKDGPRLITKSRGDIVVAYSGGSWSGPHGLGNDGNADVDTHWAFATDMVEYRLTSPEALERTKSEAWERRTGRMRFRIERVAAITTDLSSLFAVKVDTLT